MTMYRACRQTQPRVPTSPEDFGALLLDQQASSYNKNFRGTVSAGGQFAFIFFSDFMMARLDQVTQSFYDGTFYVVPSLFEQLFTVVGMFGRHPLPMIHVIMTGRKEELYSAVLEKVLSLAPKFSPHFWMGDFEASSRSSIKTWFPQAEVAGCHFHFTRAVFKKVQRLGMTDLFKSNPEFRLFIKHLMALPFLQAADIPVTVAYLFEQVLSLDLPDES